VSDIGRIEATRSAGGDRAPKRLQNNYKSLVR
jgi:hypothetical protein